MLLAPNSGWENVPLLSILRENLQTDIFVDNEANLAAIGEQFFGSAKGHSDVLYVSLGRGLGGGIMLNGQIYNGETGIAGEFGHMTVNPDGALCNCGNYGCWETEVNQAAIVRYLRETAKPAATKDLDLSIAGIIEAAQRGNSSVATALDKVGRRLGIGLASLLNTLNPGLIVFGGEFSAAADFLLPAARAEMGKRALKWAAKSVEMKVARFGSNAAVMGGIAIIFQSVLRELSGLKRNDPKSDKPKSITRESK